MNTAQIMLSGAAIVMCIVILAAAERDERCSGKHEAALALALVLAILAAAAR